MYTAEQIREKQNELNNIVNKSVEHITNDIYNRVQDNPECNEIIFQHTMDKHIKSKLEELGFKVEDYLGGVYRDAWWTKITWNN